MCEWPSCARAIEGQTLMRTTAMMEYWNCVANCLTFILRISFRNETHEVRKARDAQSVRRLVRSPVLEISKTVSERRHALRRIYGRARRVSSQHLLGKMPTPTAEAAILRVT